jgi:hypothetical protein
MAHAHRSDSPLGTYTELVGVYDRALKAIGLFCRDHDCLLPTAVIPIGKDEGMGLVRHQGLSRTRWLREC